MSTGTEAALAEFRRTRRRRYVEEIDVMEVLYRVYVGAIFAAIGLGVLAGAMHEAPASASALEQIRVHAPPIIGIALGLAVLAGLRSGGHGGPLAIEPAEVQYTLLAPLDRGLALRPAAYAQLRIAAAGGGVVGAAVGNFAFRRFPGSPVEWIACLALFGALVPVCVLGGALLAAGLRLRPLLAGGIGVALALWSAADLVFDWTTSPATMLGELATLPLQHGARIALAGAGVLLTLALVGVGLIGIGGILLEAARRRAALAAELRFSAAVSDLRTVVLLRRQLASERPRRRPWLRIHSGGAHPVWRRGWQSLMRWPLVRILRVLALAVAAGVVAAAAWSASIVLFVLPGALLFVAALDLVEPLAQESDHPTRSELLPADAAKLFRHHLVAPSAALVGVVAAATLAAWVTAGDVLALELGAILIVPLALALACCAAFSAAYDPFQFLNLSPNIRSGLAAAPPGVAALAVGMPLLLARDLWLHDRSPLAGAFQLDLLVLGLSGVAVYFLGELIAKRTAVRPMEAVR